MIDHDNLEEFADPVNYDMEDAGDTSGISFYSVLAQETGDPVLELACGTGRVTIPIARLGFQVTGLDIVPGMLDRARAKSASLSVHWVEGDARTFDLGEQYRLIFLTGNAFQAFVTNVEQAAVLQRVHTHLHDDGLFAFETRNPMFSRPQNRERRIFLLTTSDEEEIWPSFVDVNGNEVRITRTQVYDHVAQILHLKSYKRWHVGEQEYTRMARTALRYTFPQELAALLHYNGFTIIRQYGDWSLEPLTATSPGIISVCRKRM
ncbi:MAG: class I SAM-dependent methyltransferase [Chloroflexota bacterium]